MLTVFYWHAFDMRSGQEREKEPIFFRLPTVRERQGSLRSKTRCTKLFHAEAGME
jgi:hypothetical protein